MANLVIPTEREGVKLRSVTDTEDSAWLLTTRRFSHPLPPHQVGAPDHDTFKKLRQEHKREQREDPNTLNMGIWDTYNYKYKGIRFIGYVALYAQEEKIAKVGYRIAEQYRGLGYATVATRALINYARRERGIETVVAEMRPSNLASQQVAKHLGFELTETRRNLLVFTQYPQEVEDQQSF